MNNNCSVLIVEDHNLLRAGLRSMLSAQMGYHVAGEARDGREACQLAISLCPDLILMDLSLPGMNGIDAIAAIKRRSPGIRIIALSVHQNDEYVREALRAGVDGYVLKDTSFDDLVTAMRVVLLGKKHLSPELYGNLVESYVSGHEMSTAKTGWDLLTARERSVLKLVAEGRSNRQVGIYMNLSPKTIEKYRASLMRKLGITNLTELVLIAISMGLITSLARKYCDDNHPSVTNHDGLDAVPLPAVRRQMLDEGHAAGSDGEASP
ncbi:DNA-binding NarL/FixJ family response regulator [Cupriavidus metallidurans]|uniref:response regulator n=1 Tax=Cupriavidus TaxID=106589 RepID=UPI000492EB47|nr:response regulator transcription factor [Cupriavidus metallidurans]KWW32776.1 Transcriptional regulatory protein DegU [Cupriavidus metallidurans]MDE4920042.1 response regulator transcription factor [Cupriavidus metallidurans]